MAFILVIDPRATQEVHDIVAWREADKAGSGVAFLDALDACYDRISTNPTGCQKRIGEYRHVMVVGFKYRVVFRINGKRVFVLQVRHTSRKPSKRYGP